MKVPFVDLAKQNRPFQKELAERIAQLIAEGKFVLGPAVEQFESAFAQFVGTAHCVGVNSGTSALQLALRACDIGPGDEVITTPHSWISTCWAISYAGARPVFVDIDPATATLDPTAVESAITPQTKAILPVHLYGRICDMTALRAIADRHRLLLIEDAAQAHGAVWRGRGAGAWGDIGCFSFYPGKNLGALGEAGAVVTGSAQLAERIRRLRDHAQEDRHRHVEIGFNARMDAIQAAALNVKLPHLPASNSKRTWAAHLYNELLADVPEIQIPGEAPADAHVWHLYVVLARGIGRDELQRGLAQQGVATAVHYPTPIPLQRAYACLGHRSGDFPVAEDMMSRCLSLPLFAEMTVEQIEYVAAAVRRVVEDWRAANHWGVRQTRPKRNVLQGVAIQGASRDGSFRQTNSSDRRRWLHRIASSRCAS